MQTSPTRRWTSLFLCGLLCALPPLPALAGPSGEVVVEGQAEFSRPDDQTTVIDTFTDTTIIEYDSFDILQGELVEINQPHSHSKAINHVPFGEMTQINGSLHSNGFVYIVNPAGIFLGDTAVVDVGGLVAAAGRISYDDFLAGEERFTELGGEVVVAEGALVRADDTVALLGARVANYGTIVSEGGMVAFIAGQEAMLGSLNGRMTVRVDGGGDPLPDDTFALTQAGSVDAGDGRVLLTAGDTYSLAMNHTGITRGREIELHAAQDGLVQVAGTLDASASGRGEEGGSVHVTGEKIAVTDARIDASGHAGGGEIRIGGDVQGRGDLRTADRTYVGPEAELVADAIKKGDGGSIVVWSEEKTGFYGSASARGGSRRDGDGGFIEISGRQSLDARGHHVDLSAPNGRTGTLLYDPDKIEIRGGAPEMGEMGSDGDGNPAELDPGTLGQILNSTDGLDDPFIVYESEIEGTNANIILQATQEIYVNQDDPYAFDNNVGVVDPDGEMQLVDEIVLMPGNSLVIQTTGSPFDDPDFPDDGGYAIDLGEDLTWKVWDGGIIDIRTQFSNPNDADVVAIRVGRLVWGGRAFVNNADDPSVQPGLLVADPLDPHPLNDSRFVQGTAVSIQAQSGTIEVGEIVADGADAAVVAPDDPDTMEIETDEYLRLAEAGGDVRIGTQDGHVIVGSISSVGGDAYDAADPDERAPSRGGNGGRVEIDVGGGTALIQGDIIADGGNGLAGGFRRDYLDDPLFPDGRGGRGGNIAVNGDLPGAPGGSILVHGSISANGGDGDGVVQPSGFPLTAETAQGGPSGSIRLVADGNVDIAGPAPPDPMNPVPTIVISATGGDGLRGGGSAGVSPDPQANQQTLLIQTTGIQDGGAGYDVTLQNVMIDTSGGNADPGSNGASGGTSGAILIGAGTGSDEDSGAALVDALDNVIIRANGGDGAAPSDPDGTSIRPGNGGGTLGISISGALGVSVDEIESTGGAGAMGDGGLGGNVTLAASAGNVVVNDVNVDGGNATGPDGEVWLGGDAGVVRLDAGDTVQIGGQVRGFGGSGLDEDAMPTHAGGAVLIVSGDTAIEALNPSARLEGGTLTLNAPRVGAPGAPIDLAGTLADDDTAFVTGSESIEVNLLDIYGPMVAETASGLELLTISQSDETGQSLVTADGLLLLDPILVVSGAANQGENATIERMETGDDHPSLVFVLTAADDNDRPGLVIGTGAVSLGANGGIIRNQSGAIVAESGALLGEAHLTSAGNAVLEATDIGELDNAIRVGGGPDASLRLLATGEIHVDMFESASFGDLAVVQNAAAKPTTIRSLDAMDMPGAQDVLHVMDVTDPDAMGPTVAELRASTPTGTDLTYRHADPGTAAGEPTLQLHTVVLGGDGTFSSTGDLELTNPTGASVTLNTAGADLHLQAGVDAEVNGQLVDTDGSIVVTERAGDPAHIVMAPGMADDTANLVLEADGDVGGDEVLITEGVQRLAAGFDGDFRMRNDGGALQIAEIEIPEFDVPAQSGSARDLGLVADAQEITFLGIRSGTAAGSDFELDNGNEAGDAIVLGEFTTVQNPNDGSFNATHVSVTGNASFLSPILVDNAQTITLDDGDDETVDEDVMVNSARVAAGGDVLFTGTIDSAVPDMMEGEVSGTFVVDAAGTTTYEGDVGVGQALARFDTSSSRFDGMGSGAALSVEAEDVVFRGAVNGPSALTVTGVEVDPGLDPDDDDSTSISFGGNVGAVVALESLDATADGIHFAVAGGGSAEQVVVDDYVTLSTEQGAGVVPSVATITDTAGNLRIAAGGDVTISDASSFEKLTAVGELEIEAGGTVTVGDLSASRIRIDAPTIEVVTRNAGPVQLPDGSLSDDDGGVDWVANAIVTTAAPQTVGAPGGPLSLYLGSGGVSIPGGLSGYQLSYANSDRSSVGGFIGEDGTVLDLTGEGPPVFGDPTRSVPHSEKALVPEAPPVFGSDAPAPASRVSGRQMLAFLRCSGLAPAARGSGCDAEDQAALAAVERFDDGPLATERAREITRRYGELLTEPGATERLRAAFASAGRAFGETVEWRHGELDGAAFYRFLASAPEEQREALASMRELAWLFTQLDLLGLTDADTRRLQSLMAQEFADAAGLQGFDAAEVTAAVDASPIGLPGPPDAARP